MGQFFWSEMFCTIPTEPRSVLDLARVFCAGACYLRQRSMF
jgi:hypothetical protein